MKEILLISDTALAPELDLMRTDIQLHGFNLSDACGFNEALELLHDNPTTQVLINAYARKLEVYELCREIKNAFKGSIKVYVYLPQSNASEGSKFGLVNAEVEDENSIVNLINKLTYDDKSLLPSEQSNITLVCGLNGGAGTSTLTSLMAYALTKHKQRVLVSEINSNLSIAHILGCSNKPSMLARDRSKEIDQTKDIDWFTGYISRAFFANDLLYLHLISSASDKAKLANSYEPHLNKLQLQLKSISEKSIYYQHSIEDFDLALQRFSVSMDLLKSELNNESLSQCQELIKHGATVADQIIIDIGSDLNTGLAKQLLKIAKNLVCVFRDDVGVSESYHQLKDYISASYKLKITPVLSPQKFQHHDYLKLNWSTLLGSTPFIFPYEPEPITRFTLDHEEVDMHSKLISFVDKLNEELSLFTKFEASRRGLLNFLVKNA